MTKEIEYDGGMNVYIDFSMVDDDVKVHNISICVSLYGVNVDITDEVMYYINKPQHSKNKKQMLQSIIQYIQNEDTTTDIF